MRRFIAGRFVPSNLLHRGCSTTWLRRVWATSAPSSVPEPPELSNVIAELAVFENGAMPQSAVRLLWSIQSKLANDEDYFSFVNMLAEAHVDKQLVEAELLQLQKSMTLEPQDLLQQQQRLYAKASKLKLLVTPLWETWLAQSLHSHLDALFQFRCRILKLKELCDAFHHKHHEGPEQEIAIWQRRRATVSAVDSTMQRLLKDWFGTANLSLQQLSWSNTPASVVEQVMKNERVHPFASLHMVKGRMQPTQDRQMYALGHAGVEGPLVAIQVALTSGVESSVDTILGRKSPVGEPRAEGPPDTAIFYSINSTQDALRGIDLGNALIKQVVAQMPPSIKTFSTLSPIPGYFTWLQNEVRKLERSQQARLFGVCEPSVEEQLFNQLKQAFDGPHLTKEQVAFNLMSLLEDDTTMWWWDAEFAALLRQPLLRSVAWYLVREKKRNKLLDPVGNFHVSNGAQIFRLNWLANCSFKGNRESACVMVNYRYNLASVEGNAHEYELHHRVDVGEAVMNLLR